MLKKETEKHLLAHHRNFKEFAKVMVNSHGNRFDKIFWGIIDQYVKNPKTIVDFGTGPANLLIDLKGRFPNATVIGVEAQPEMVKVAKETIKSLGDPDISLIVNDLMDLPIKGIKKNSVDFLIMSMVFHELPVPALSLVEIERILKKGGVALIYDWNRIPLENYTEGRLPKTIDEVTHFSEHCRYTPEDIIFMAKKSNLKLLEFLTRSSGKHGIFILTK